MNPAGTSTAASPLTAMASISVPISKHDLEPTNRRQKWAVEIKKNQKVFRLDIVVSIPTSIRSLPDSNQDAQLILQFIIYQLCAVPLRYPVSKRIGAHGGY